MNILGFTPTLPFWISLLPAPFLLYYNYRVLVLLLKVRTVARGNKLRYPAIYHQGRALGMISAGFALLPAIVEWRIFVLNPLWCILYLTGGLLGVLALRMVRRGLTLELKRLSKPRSAFQHK